MSEHDKNLSLVEDTTTPNAPNVETTDENLSVTGMFQQQAIPSLGRQIFGLTKMHGPTAKLFNVRKKDGTNDLELVHSDVIVENSTSVPTKITAEAVEDIKRQFASSASKYIGVLLRGLANDQENTKTLAFLDTNSLDSGAVALSAPNEAKKVYDEIAAKVQELVLKANSKNRRTFQAYCVLPYTLASKISAASAIYGREGSIDGLHVATVGTTKYFMNPDPAATDVYVGLSCEDISKCAAVFASYEEDVIKAIDPDSGEENYHIYNRYAIAKSPLHVAGNEMMFKFTAA